MYGHGELRWSFDGEKESEGKEGQKRRCGGKETLGFSELRGRRELRF